MTDTNTCFNPRLMNDPYRWFQYMRDEQPVYYDPEEHVWHVFRYEDVAYIFAKYELFETYPRSVGVPQFDDLFHSMMITMDPPRHRNYRYPIAQAFTAPAIARLQEKVQTIVQGLLDQIRTKGEIDFTHEFAFPLHGSVAAALLDFPPERHADLKRWSDTLILSGVAIPLAERLAVLQEIEQYFREELLPQRRLDLHDDLISELLRISVEGRSLDDFEIISFFVAIMLGSHETTPNLLCHAMCLCDEYPEVVREMRRCPEVVPTAIEEVLRFRSPFWRLPRKVKTDVVLGGQVIPRDSMIFAWNASANRDPEQFVDPERFDIRRTPNRHLAFGYGIHHCLGLYVARLEATTALPMILDQLPDIHRDHRIPFSYLESDFIYGLNNLPMTFTPRG